MASFHDDASGVELHCEPATSCCSRCEMTFHVKPAADTEVNPEEIKFLLKNLR
jgi:hypothetical protein